MKILFVVKNRQFAYSQTPSYSNEKPFSSGLFNSTRFVVDMLRDRGVDAVLESAIDNNCIDRLVTLHRPTHVILEALWVVPSKFKVLQRLHPGVRWSVRLHSEVPFIAGEGIAMEWVHAYRRLGVTILANSRRMADNLAPAIATPNVYPLDYLVRRAPVSLNRVLDVGCFGALRPLKNQLAQAVAAIAFADHYDVDLYFHINGTRSENGDAIRSNLRALFDHYPRHTLVEHDWYPHERFREVLSKMDVLLQVSFSETYNIVAADAVSQLVPVVGSSEIPFVARPFTADPTSIDSIVRGMRRALTAGIPGARLNRGLLRCNVKAATRTWMRVVRSWASETCELAA